MTGTLIILQPEHSSTDIQAGTRGTRDEGNDKRQKLKFLITGWRVPGGVSRAGYKYGNIPG